MTTHTEKLIQDGLWRDISEAPRDDYTEILWWDNEAKMHVVSRQHYSECYGAEKTHFRPLPDDRLANALKVAVEALDLIAGDHMHTGHSLIAQAAITEIERIAKGEQQQ